MLTCCAETRPTTMVLAKRRHLNWNMQVRAEQLATAHKESLDMSRGHTHMKKLTVQHEQKLVHQHRHYPAGSKQVTLKKRNSLGVPEELRTRRQHCQPKR